MTLVQRYGIVQKNVAYDIDIAACTCYGGVEGQRGSALTVLAIRRADRRMTMVRQLVLNHNWKFPCHAPAGFRGGSQR